MSVGFNTSHVSVRFTSQIFTAQTVLCFNTSHVSVRCCVAALRSFIVSFQYISCVGSILSKYLNWSSTPLFQYISCVGSMLKYEITVETEVIVSIHLMCRFDCFCKRWSHTANICFNTSHVSVRSSSSPTKMPSFVCFNTSHVSVRSNTIKEIDKIFFVSIHLMCRFDEDDFGLLQ